MVFGARRGDKGVDFGEWVRGDDIDGLELLGEGCGVSGSVRDVRVGGRGKEPCKAGEDHDKEHEAFRSQYLLQESIYSKEIRKGVLRSSGLQCDLLGARAHQGSRIVHERKSKPLTYNLSPRYTR